MLRELTRAERLIVSGGDDDGEGGIIVNGRRERQEDVGNFSGSMGMNNVFLGGTEQYLVGMIAGPVYSDDEDTDGDGTPNWEEDPIIVEGSSAIHDFDSSMFGSFFARLFPDGTYIQYRQEIISYGLWGLDINYYPIGSGTYTRTFNEPAHSLSFPPSYSYTFGGRSYTFDPD